jgi:hypothetical protein
MHAENSFSTSYSESRPPALATFSLWFGIAFAAANLLYGAVDDVSATECLWGMIHVMRAIFIGLLLASVVALRRGGPAGFGAAARPLLINLLTLFAVFI